MFRAAIVFCNNSKIGAFSAVWLYPIKTIILTPINKIKTTKTSILNGMDIKTATFINKEFPFHFHDLWSLGFIEAGNEYISFNKSEVLLSNNAQILIPPFSLHKNWGQKNNMWTYKALYLKSETIMNLANQLKLDYFELCSFPYFVKYADEKFSLSEIFILKTLKFLFLNKNNESTLQLQTSNKPFYLNEMLNFITENYNSKITLSCLEEKFKQNKFKILRIFKNEVGISPLGYQMSIRIEKSKQHFLNDYPLTQIAYESGFFDQSHFSHCFKKYVGVTPGEYKEGCNILQDQGFLLS